MALVDVAIQAFGKPNQTALSILSLLRHSADKINRIFCIVELSKPVHDLISLSCLEGLHPKLEILTTKTWIGLDEIQPGQLMKDDGYRQSVRYQLAWERSELDHLLVIHNDVYFTADIIKPFLDAIGDSFAIGEIGQCWVCPAAYPELVTALGINGGRVCERACYSDFQLSFNDLDAMYRLARSRRVPHRNFFKSAWAKELVAKPWPLPECRVNEFCCLVNMRLARAKTMPHGHARPFGAYAMNADLGIAWFRDLNHQGLRARHFPVGNYLEHHMGHFKMWDPDDYRSRENQAAQRLRDDHAEYLPDLRARGLEV